MPAGVFNAIFGNRVGADWYNIRRFRPWDSPAHCKVVERSSIWRRDAHPHPVFAEMSSINPVVILPQALARRGQHIRNWSLPYARLRSVLHQAGVIVALRGAAFDRLAETMSALVNAAEPQPMLNTGTLEHYSHGLAALDAPGYAPSGAAAKRLIG